ncbi:MAG TPA: hypothetical protein VMH83_01540, partial [Candidatus Acidoferrum sp.]|nr:hypothetical protein [Candidatus Acidoferrum sp.]
PVLRTKLTLVAIVYCLWGIVTTLWSEQQQLSLFKSLAALFVTIPVLAGGYLWAREHEFEDVLSVLLPLTICALLAGLLGRFSTAAIVNTGRTVLYQGLVNGPNMFGSMLAMCSPLLMWQVRHHFKKKQLFWVWLAAALIGTYYLFAASSRGSILVMLTTLAFFMTTVPLARRLQLGIFAVIGIAIALMLVPDLYDRFKAQYIYKQAVTTHKSVFYTRQDVWEESMEKAKEGGVFGGGYGVSIGNRRQFHGGFTAVGYGREKGNSQLAIVEEVGLVGFGLYLIMMVTLFGRMLITAWQWPRCTEKQVLLTVTGILTGMTVQSFFEAWWVAPGSPEFVYFWTMAGIGLGLSSRRPASFPIPVPALMRRRHRQQMLAQGGGAHA